MFLIGQLTSVSFFVLANETDVLMPHQHQQSSALVVVGVSSLFPFKARLSRIGNTRLPHKRERAPTLWLIAVARNGTERQ